MSFARRHCRWIAFLVTFLVSFQATAGVGRLPCVHTARHASMQNAMQAAVGHHHAAMMAMAGMAGMAMADGGQDSNAIVHASSAYPNPLAAKLLGCGCGCSCAGQCTAPCSGVIGDPVAVRLPDRDPSRMPALPPVALASAHGLDLVRPPSMS